ncbi:acyltransferase [Curtobacterium flaccumfaciens]|nr:acyltransferase [Curtobacterium flaccumfaciens]
MNWVFLGRAADYWASASSTSPLQHFWSLSVELQFYVAFPVLLIATWRSIRRADPVRARRATVLASSVLLVISGCWAWILGAASPGAAYFDTGTRLWELAAGASLGAVSVRAEQGGSRVPKAMRIAGVYTGFGVIVLAGLTAPAADAVPVPDAVPAVVGALLVLVSGQGLPPLPVLRWRLVQWFGDRSYSIYLWHLPAVIAAGLVFPGQRVVAGAVAIVAGSRSGPRRAAGWSSRRCGRDVDSARRGAPSPPWPSARPLQPAWVASWPSHSRRSASTVPCGRPRPGALRRSVPHSGTGCGPRGGRAVSRLRSTISPGPSRRVRGL